jgi:hypothetical protein
MNDSMTLEQRVEWVGSGGNLVERFSQAFTKEYFLGLTPEELAAALENVRFHEVARDAQRAAFSPELDARELNHEFTLEDGRRLVKAYVNTPRDRHYLIVSTVAHREGMREAFERAACNPDGRNYNSWDYCNRVLQNRRD